MNGFNTQLIKGIRIGKERYPTINKASSSGGANPIVASNQITNKPGKNKIKNTHKTLTSRFHFNWR